jgi:hypothetical protein
MLGMLANDLTHAAGIDEVVTAIHQHLRQIVNYDTLAVYVRRNDSLEPVSVVGENRNLISTTVFPVKKGLSGWVAEHRSPILNGDPICWSAARVVPPDSPVTKPLSPRSQGRKALDWTCHRVTW